MTSSRPTARSSRGAQAAGLYADAAPFSDEERAKIRADLGAGYARFKARVAEGRDMTDKEVEAVARGRVWTGAQALERGLVDELGDLHAAADQARELAGLDPRRYAPLVQRPSAQALPAAPALPARTPASGWPGWRPCCARACLPWRRGRSASGARPKREVSP